MQHCAYILRIKICQCYIDQCATVLETSFLKVDYRSVYGNSRYIPAVFKGVSCQIAVISIHSEGYFSRQSGICKCIRIHCYQRQLLPVDGIGAASNSAVPSGSLTVYT